MADECFLMLESLKNKSKLLLNEFAKIWITAKTYNLN